MRETELELKALMLKGLDGDAAAQARLLSGLSALLRPFFARRLGRDDGDVEDLVQECLIAVHVRRESFDRSGLFTPWAFAIARYKLIDCYRRRRVRAWSLLEEVGELFAPDRADGTMPARDLGRLLDGLPARQRDAIRRTRIEGLSTEEAAAATGMSPSLVKVNVHRGLKTLMARVGKGGGDADR
ncbi:MAG: sigma-70 family RNA polymerase sigma factor [Pseudomonadota bacterium]